MTTPRRPAQAPLGILLMTYGSPATDADIPQYLQSIRRGTPAPADLVAEFTRRYRRIGFSPLLRITQAQAHALQEQLDDRDGRDSYRVEVGMLHSDPSVATAIHRLAGAHVTTVIGITLAPQYSPTILAGYHRAVAAAVGAAGAGINATIAGAWHLEPGFVSSLAGLVEDALAGLGSHLRSTVPVIFTAHSLPRTVVERDPGYILQLQDTVAAIVSRVGLAPERWQFAYQSAGHTPEEWLRPDVTELLPGLCDAGYRDVLVVPVQFVSDHLEILYDIDVAAVEEAAAVGITMHRIRLPNTSAAFIEALAAVVHREAETAGGPPPAW